MGGFLRRGSGPNVFPHVMAHVRPHVLTAAASGPSYDADAEAYFTAATVTETAYKNAINQFVLDLKAASLWTKFDRLWILANQNETAALTCLVSLNQDASAVNSPTFTAGEGYTGNGTTSYINTNWNPSTDGVNFTLNAASLGVFVRAAVSEERTVIGASNGNGGTSIRAWWSDNKTYSSLNTQNGGAGPNATLASRLGLLTVVRTASNANVLYQGATSRATSAQAAEGVQNNLLGILSLTGESAAQLSTAQVSLAFAGGSLSAQNMTDLSAAVDTLKASIGWG